MESWAAAVSQTAVLLQYVNIFFIAGVCYLLLALLRKLRLPSWGYLLLAVLLFLVTPFLYMTEKSTGLPALDYILTIFLGGRAGVSLCFLPHLSYTLFGVWFGRILRRVSNKKTFYLCILPGAAVIAVGYLLYAILSHDTLGSLYNFI